MARSASRHASRGGVLCGLAAAGLALGGCATSAQTAARLRAENVMQLPAGPPVTKANTLVRIDGLQRVGARRGGAIVVTLRNLAPSPQVELPISVGYTVAGRAPVSLNRSASFFAGHVASIGAHATATWVLESGDPVPARARLFATVGAEPAPAITRAQSLPAIDATVITAGVDAIEVAVRNRSDIPQEQLQLVAVALRGGSPVGAALGQVARLAGGARTRVRLALTGTATGATVRVEALPTIFD